MKLSERALKLTPSEPRWIYDEVQKYTGVIYLTLGRCRLRESRRESEMPDVKDGISGKNARIFLLQTIRVLNQRRTTEQ